jgi:hypothetical protein
MDRPRTSSGRAARALVAIATLLAISLLVAACGTGDTTPSPSAAASTPSVSPAPSGGASASPGGPPGASAGPSATTDPAVEALADEIAGQVSEIRELPLETPLDTAVLDQDGLEAFVRRSFEEETSEAELDASDGMLTRLGLLDADEDLGELYLELLGSQVLGLYDDETKQLYVVSRGEAIGGLEKFTISHEIDHALQDQAFDLGGLIPDVDDEGDLVLARQALAEGDATLVGVQWATSNLTPEELVEVAQAAADSEQQALLERMPTILTEVLQFPYLAGLDLVLAVQGEDGWAGVDRLYADPPDSTEQVLHPEKYQAGEAPLDVELPADLATRMGSGWTGALEDTFGEFQASVWLREGGIARTTADDAAEGWGGDRMAYLTGPDGADAVVWRTAWDTAADARQFLDSAGRAVGDGDSPGTVIRASDTEVVVILASDGPALDAAVAAMGYGAAS